MATFYEHTAGDDSRYEEYKEVCRGACKDKVYSCLHTVRFERRSEIKNFTCNEKRLEKFCEHIAETNTYKVNEFDE